MFIPIFILVNEPWWLTPIDILQKFYKDSNNLVQASAPKWVTVLHDSFRPSRAIWAEFMHDCVNCALDTHIYQAWAWPNEQGWFTGRACMDGDRIKTSMEMYDIPIIVGEWSLAIDNCAMWLNGFNDNVPGYPLVECERIKCPEPYMGEGQANAPPDPSKDAQDPFGTGGESYVINGTCPRDGFIANEDVFMRKLAYIKLNAFDYGTHGQFFWNFRTELEPRWDYQAAVARGWIPATYDNSTMSEIASACDNPYDIPDSAMLKSAAPKLKESAHLHSTPFELFSRGGQPYPYNPTTHSLPRDIIPGLSQDTGSVSNTSLSVSSTSHMLVSLTALVILSLFAVWYWIRQKSMGSRKQQYASISSYVTDSGKYTGSDKYGFASERDSLLRGHYQTSVGRVDEINI